MYFKSIVWILELWELRTIMEAFQLNSHELIQMRQTICQLGTGASAVGAGHELLRLAGLLVESGVTQAEVAVVVWQGQTVGSFLRGWEEGQRENKSGVNILGKCVCST